MMFIKQNPFFKVKSSNLVYWSDFSKSQNTTLGTGTLVNATKNLVSTQSISQSVDANKPNLLTNSVNGQQGLYCNSNAGGANGDSLKLSSGFGNLDLKVSTTNTNGFTIFVVGQINNLTPPSGSSGCMLYGQATTPATNSMYEVVQWSGGNIGFNVIDGSIGVQRWCAAGSVAANTPFIFTGWWDKANTKIQGRIGSGTINNGDGAVTTLASTLQLFALGQQKNGQPTRQLDGYIHEVAIFNELLNSSERDIIGNYLGKKYKASY